MGEFPQPISPPGLEKMFVFLLGPWIRLVSGTTLLTKMFIIVIIIVTQYMAVNSDKLRAM